MNAKQQKILRDMEQDAVAIAALVIASRSGRDSNQVPLGSRLDHEIARLPDRISRLMDLADGLKTKPLC
jgi:hypothetical protein